MGVDEWDIYQTDEVATWLRELQDSDQKTADLVDDAIYTLSRSGPALGRQLVDTITNSKIANLKDRRAGLTCGETWFVSRHCCHQVDCHRPQSPPNWCSEPDDWCLCRVQRVSPSTCQLADRAVSKH